MSDITRKEKYYSAIIGGGAVPEPITREEQYLAQMAQGGGGGGASVYIGASTNPPAVPAEGMLWVVTDDDTLDVPNGDNLSY